MKKQTKGISVLVLTIALALAAAPVSWSNAVPKTKTDEVRSALNQLPFITAFDYINFEINGDTVHLMGSVIKPWDKTDAERLVSKVAGVSSVINDIEVLPLSRMDDAIRLNAYRALFNRNSSLLRYAVGSYAPIRIIVKNGHITLEGFVNSEFDKRVADLTVRTVPNVFSVTNNLKIG